MTYEINLNFYYQTFDTFKQKSSLILQSLFAGGRMIDYAKFHGYGLITTNGHKADIITIEDTDKFNRAKTNCIIYNLTYNKWNPGKFDKLFIYRTNMSKDNAFYGFILYNTETNKMTNVYNIEYSDDRLYQYIYRSIIGLVNKELFEHYSKKYDCLKGRNGLSLKNIPVHKDWEKMKQHYEDFIKLPFNPKETYIED
jgi:hypothetical protein